MQSASSEAVPKHSWQFEAIGTRWSIETPRPLSDGDKNDIDNIIALFDKTYSRFRDDSLVSQIEKTAGRYDFPANAEKLIDFYRNLYDATNGAMSPLVGGILADAGYDKEYSLQPGAIRDAPSWDDAMEWSGSHIVAKLPVLLDFGAAGKGYLVDLIAQYMEKAGDAEYVIDASGDMRVRGPVEIVGLENPFDTTTVIGTYPLKNASLCGSATTRRAWGEWHHVIDARTAQPTDDIIATWAIAPTTLEADGLATALFFIDGDALSQWDFSYVRLHRNGHIEHSPNFVGELFS